MYKRFLVFVLLHCACIVFVLCLYCVRSHSSKPQRAETTQAPGPMDFKVLSSFEDLKFKVNFKVAGRPNNSSNGTSSKSSGSCSNSNGSW